MNRNLTLIVHFVLDQCVPPWLRDQRWLMAPLFRLVLGPKAWHYLDFKDRLPYLSEQDIQAYYTLLADTFIRRKTDLNRQSVQAVLRAVQGSTVLDVACGSGWLSQQLARQGLQVVAADITAPDPTIGQANPMFCVADVTQLPFKDGAFDTVVCAHTLEHVSDMAAALSEIRRVCRRRLIVVIPCQREYRYTFDLHVHFFPYAYKLQQLMGAGVRIDKAGGDFVAIEDMLHAVQP
jgi:ubiquinone/menaquinone biosynthesis C-methylase UbiE